MSSGSLQQAIELTAAVERNQFIRPSNRISIDKNLRHRACAAGPFGHLLTQRWIAIDTDFGKFDGLFFEQTFRPRTERTEETCVHFNSWHGSHSAN